VTKRLVRFGVHTEFTEVVAAGRLGVIPARHSSFSNFEQLRSQALRQSSAHDSTIHLRRPWGEGKPDRGNGGLPPNHIEEVRTTPSSLYNAFLPVDQDRVQTA
jgi:hypothetical protein